MTETYITPRIEVVEILSEHPILTASDPNSPYFEPGEDF